MGGPIDVTRGRRLTEVQRERLCHLAYLAFLELRALCWAGKSEQAAALADAFHELPSVIYAENFNWDWARRYLENYEADYPAGATYLAEFDAVPR